MISTTAPSLMDPWPAEFISLQESSSKAGRRRLPPPARRYSPISVIARTPETVSRPNSRSMAARSSCSRSKTSLALWVTVGFKACPSVGSIVGKLHVDAEIALLQHGDDFLQRVAVFAADAHQVALNGSLHFLLRVLDDLDNLARLLDGDALLHGDALAHRRSGGGLDCTVG